MSTQNQVTAEQIREHYDSLALIYRAFWGDQIHHGLFTDNESPAAAQVKMLAYCAEVLGLRGGEEVLDVGCGHGGTLIHLAEMLGCSGTGLTISPTQARIANDHAARSHLTEKLKFMVADADGFPFPPKAFDVVWVMESSEHLLDKSGFFRNVAHTLRRVDWFDAQPQSRRSGAGFSVSGAVDARAIPICYGIRWPARELARGSQRQRRAYLGNLPRPGGDGKTRS